MDGRIDLERARREAKSLLREWRAEGRADPKLADAHERAVHRFAAALVSGAKLSDAEFAEIEQVLGLSMTRVAYRGSAPIINDLVGGHLPFAVTTLSDLITQHRAGGLRIVAVSGAERSQFLPEVATLKQSGVDLVGDAWYGMWLPAGS